MKGMFRATSHMNQGPWPCNGEGLWFSLEGHTMDSGIAMLGSHGPSCIVCSENGPCWGIFVCFIGGNIGPALPHLLHAFHFFHSLLEFYIGQDGNNRAMEHIERKGRVLVALPSYWCLHMVVQYKLGVQELAFNGKMGFCHDFWHLL